MPKLATGVNPQDLAARSGHARLTTLEEDTALQAARDYLRELDRADRELSNTRRIAAESEGTVQNLRQKRSQTSDPAERQELSL